MNNRLDNSKRLIDNDIWKSYKGSKHFKKYPVENREEFKLIVKEIFKVIGEQLLTKPAGVFIKNFGYFFIWKIPVKRPYALTTQGKPITLKYNIYTDMYSYSPIFKPAKRFRGWFMDNSFNSNIKSGLHNKLINESKVYKTFVNTFKNLLH